MKTCILDYTYEEIEELVLSLGEKKFRAKQLFDGLYSGKKIDEISNLSKEFKNKISENYFDEPIKIHTKLVSKDKTVKYIYELYDGNLIEGVLMKYKYGYTLCISTQVGCRMGCKFCASGLDGLIRNLTAGEILGQVLAVNKDIDPTQKRNITNLVLMGSGEPLDNFDNVIKFIKLVNDERGINISQRNISLSTSGLIEKIKQIAELDLQITLTISLHAPNDEIRRKTMPVAFANPYDELIKAAKYYFEKTKRRVVFEYAMINGINDSIKAADELISKIKGFPCHVNLIPLNEVKERKLSSSTKKDVYKFCDYLNEKGISATVRRTMGEDIGGACGQLRNKILKRG